jgi:uncharacterized protein YndB with AHSA1/START domain
VKIVDTEQVLHAPVRDVWEALVDTSRWREWMGVSDVTVEQPSASGAFGLSTVFVVRGPVTDRYEVVEFTPPHRMGYRLLSGKPSVFRNYRADLTLTGQQHSTTLRWRVTFDPRIPGSGWLFAWAVGKFFRRAMRNLAARVGSPPS